MAKHEIVIHENTGATKDAAPYLGNYISKETVRMDGFAEAVGALAGLPAIQVIAILTGVFDAIGRLERESLVRIHLDGFTVEGLIAGSFPTADAAFDPSRNTFGLALRLDDALRNCLADVVPAIAVDGSVTKLRVDNVMDLAEPRPLNVIHGQEKFRVAGLNMVLDDAEAEVHLADAKGVVYGITVDEVISKQLFIAHVGEALEPGDYKLMVKSRAGDAGGPLQTAFRKVKVLRAATPPGPVITSVTGGGEGGALAPGYGITIRGRGLALGEDDHVGAKTTTEAGEVDVDITGFVQDGDDETIQLGDGAWDEIGTPTVDTVTFTVKGASFDAHVG